MVRSRWGRLALRANRYYRGAWRLGFVPFVRGENVLDREWDLLVILDGCRADALRAVAPEYDLGAVGTLHSVGSQSKEWLAKTFTPDRRAAVERMAYVTANPFTEEVFAGERAASRFDPAHRETLRKGDFGAVVDLWRDGWDADLETVPARAVTDATVRTMRSGEYERVIAHYMQPHEPFIAGEPVERQVWKRLRRGALDPEYAWERYLANLRYVLDDVALLLASVDADRVVVTADHGNAFGEWWIYGHPIGFQHPAVTYVPWVTTSASDTGEYEPGETTAAAPDEDAIADRLRALGYVD